VPRPGSDLVSARPLHLYVAASGDDSNPGTQEAPVKTLTEAMTRLPQLGPIYHDCLIDVVEAGTYELPEIPPRDYATGQLYIRATPQTTVLASTPALTGSSAQIVKSAGLVADQFIDKWIHVLGGAAAGDWRLIKTNTATDITPVRDFTAAIAANDRYEIVEPLVVLQPSPLRPVHGDEYCAVPTARFEPGLNFENFVFDSAPPSGVSFDGRLVFWRCVFGTLTGLAPLSRSTAQALLGIDRAVGSVAAIGPQRVYGGTPTAYLGCGIVSKFNQEPEGGGWYGYFNSQHGLHVRNHIFALIAGGNIRGDHCTVRGNGVVAQIGLDTAGTPQITDGPAQNTGSLRVWEAAYCILQRGVVTANAGDIAIGVERAGTIDITGLSAAVQVNGSTYGIHCRRGHAKAFLHESAPAITGGTAKYAVGETPTTSNSLPNAGDVLAGNDGSIIERVE
jgi:hypothetical protein